MISAIHMQSCATYDEEGSHISDCKKINFIYGANGSGKSTISDFLSGKHPERYRKCSIDNGSEMTIMVYNREFRESNFHADDISGVFTLGESAIEDINALEALKQDKSKLIICRDKTAESIQKEQNKKILLEDKYKNSIWNAILKAHEKQFAEAFSGYRSNKDKFFHEVLRRYSMLADDDISYDSLVQKAESLFCNNLQSCERIELSLEPFIAEIEEIVADAIWSAVIVGNQDVPVADIIAELANSDWVNTGRQYIRQNGVCPFCQKKTIDDVFVKQLEAYFDNEYQLKISRLQELQRRYNRLKDLIIGSLERVLANDKILETANITSEKMQKLLSDVMNYFSSNNAIIEQKINEPARKVVLVSFSGILSVVEQLVCEGNSSISKHNAIVENAKKEKEKLSDKIWEYCVGAQRELIATFLKESNSLDKAISGMKQKMLSLNSKIAELDSEIVEKGKNITSVEPTVNEINRLLVAYGFTGFSIAKSNKRENAYQIQRPDGTLAENTLSEGEETFISFLYFMQLTKGSTDINHVSDNKIIVLDDPICSLDSTILYIVSTMVKQLISEIRSGKSDVKQIFILTHNVFFHKEASFVNGRTSEQADVNYWVIKKDLNVSTIIPYGIVNPISTSYELLWKELQNSEGASLITIQNTMRRIIENYFGMLGKTKDDFILNSFESVEARTICESLLYWINDGSHTIPDDLYIDSYSGSVERYKEVFKAIFVRTGNEAHYNMMMGIRKKENE